MGGVPTARLLNSRPGRIVALLGFWSIPALISASQISTRLTSQGLEPSWLRLLGLQLCVWYPWALVTPLVFGLARRFPFSRARWWRPLAVHVAASVAVAALYQLYTLGLELILRPDAFPTITSREFLLITVRFVLFGLLFAILTYWLLLGVAFALALVRRYRRLELESSHLAARNAQLEASLSQARLEALKRQLRPHFLFNALNAVSGLLESEPRTARKMLADLGGLLRVSIDIDGDQQVDLAQELEHLGSYLAIERQRFADRLTVDYEIEEEALAARVPTLILQPLVENAVRHGVAAVSRPGRILIRARRDNGYLRVEIEDNGPGPASEPLEEGVGLSNTRRRLEELYGDRHRLSLQRGVTGGVRVELSIPWSSSAKA